MPLLVQGVWEYDSEDDMINPWDHSPRRAHDRPYDEWWTVRVQGERVTVEKHLRHPPPRPKKKRSDVGIFSRGSRLRMTKIISIIDWGVYPRSIFCTLSYPDYSHWERKEDRTVHRSEFFRAVENDLGVHTPALWRVEWKPRKTGDFLGRMMPHIHVFFPGVRFLDQWKVKGWWQRILRQEGNVATDTKRILNADSRVRYLSKYVSKFVPLDVSHMSTLPDSLGRQWGLTRKDEVAYSPVVVDRVLSDKEALQLRTYAGGMLRYYDPDADAGFTLFGKEHAEKIADWAGRKA